MIEPVPPRLLSDALDRSIAGDLSSFQDMRDDDVLVLAEEELEVVDEAGLEAVPTRPNPETLRDRHWFMLSLSLLVVVLAPLLVVVGGQERIALRWWPGSALPETCYARQVIPAGCPGCGLTRSTVYLFQGRLRDAWDMHRLGPLLVLVILLQIPYRLFALYGPSPAPLGERLPQLLGYGLVALLLINWGWKIVETWGGRVP